MTFAPKTKCLFQKLAFKTEKTLPCQKLLVFDSVLPLRTLVASPSEGYLKWLRSFRVKTNFLKNQSFVESKVLQPPPLMTDFEKL